MNLLNFFITYILFLLTSSIAITAFFCVTRGDIETLPDGSERRYGKILKGYYFFWFKEKGKTQIQYKDDQLAALAYSFKEYYTEPVIIIGDPFVTGSISKFETSGSFLSAIPLLRNKLSVQFRIEEAKNDKLVVKAYSEQPVFIFPEWLRTVMAGCITCTPTVYGNIIYWGAIFFLRKSILLNSLFLCFGNIYAGVIILWLVYWISLAWLNTVLWNIYFKDH